MKTLSLLAGLTLLLLIGLTGWHTVDQSEFVYVTQFGAPVAMLDGATEAGWHFKRPWPLQTVQRLDRRLQIVDLPPAELPTNDPRSGTIDKMLTVDAYVCWRIADREGAEQFVRAVGTVERARLLLSQRVSSRLAAVISRMPLDDLIGVAEPEAVVDRSRRLHQRLLAGDGDGPDLSTEVRTAYGILLVDVRLRRFNYPPDVRTTIAERIRSERLKKVADYESEGDQRAADILSRADQEAAQIRATAAARRRTLERQADAEADRIRNEAQSQDREFYTFLQKLETYQRIFAESRDVLLLSGRHEFFDLLMKPPKRSDAEKAK